MMELPERLPEMLRDRLRAERHPCCIVRLTVDGVSLDSLIRRRLVSLTHTDFRGFEADTLDIEFDDSDGALDLPPRGAIVELAFGWHEADLVEKGKFVVQEVAHHGVPDTLSIRAASADLAAGLSTQRERSWPETTLGDIVRTIADENGLIPAVHASLADIGIEHIDQTNESAVNLLSRLAERFDAIATVKDGHLLFSPIGGVTAGGKRIPVVTITRQSGDRHQFLIADRKAYQGVRALYHDVNRAVKGEVIWGDEENATERNVRPAPPAPPAGGQYKPLANVAPTRAKALDAAKKEWRQLQANKAARAAYIGVRAKYDDRNLGVKGEVTWGEADEAKRKAAAKRQAERDKLDDGEAANAFERTAANLKTLRHVYASNLDALLAARAEWRRLQRGVATFSLALAKGIPALYPETPATVIGWKPQIDSTDWLITRVTNTIDADGGYSQRLELEIKATETPD